MNMPSPDTALPSIAVNLFARTQPEVDQLPVGWLLVLGAMAVVGGLAYWHAARMRRKRRQYSHDYLFADLCALHQLNRPSRNLLTQLARYYSLAYPARMFLEPVWLDPQRLPPPLHARAQEVVRLRAELFGISHTQPETQPS